jgi:hypothetical protein
MPSGTSSANAKKQLKMQLLEISRIQNIGLPSIEWIAPERRPARPADLYQIALISAIAVGH